MEEILASIRKIISDESTTPPPARAPAMKVVAPEPSPEPQGQDDIDALLAGFDEAEAAREQHGAAVPDVLELTEAMAAPADPPLAADDIDFIEPPSPKPTPKPAAREPARRPEPAAFSLPPMAPPQPAPGFEERLISDATDSAISAAFGKLTHTILSQNARTLDDLVQDMLRPMLKTWLDDNLPTLVERLVRAEIERVSRGGR